MSLNRYEQTLFDHIERHPEERRHWLGKVQEAGRRLDTAGEAQRALERELWDYFAERSQQVAALRELNPDGLRRVSLQNLAEHLMRLWGPPPKPKRPATG
jgi:hypothetical protein